MEYYSAIKKNSTIKNETMKIKMKCHKKLNNTI